MKRWIAVILVCALSFSMAGAVEPQETITPSPRLSETSAIIEMQASYAELPAYYNAMEEGYVTAIKQQTGFNCWAYATMASIETSLLKQGIADDRTTLDLSEALLDDAMFTRRDDPLHNTTGDMNYIKDIREGSELPWAAQMMAGGLSVADEQEYLSRGIPDTPPSRFRPT